jgi:DNA polymerase (family 10)
MARQTGMITKITNRVLVDQFERIAELLETQDANPFRVRAYRQAAATLQTLDQPITSLLATDGREGLTALPNIGAGLAGAIADIVQTGRNSLLEELEGAAQPEQVLATVPGIGPSLAQRIHAELGIATLAELERAAVDGRLEEIHGFGQRRIQGVREALAGRFRRQSSSSALREDAPPIADLIDVDREYREQATAGTLRRIAPQRFNPTGEAWLPVLHTRRGSAEYTALYSNTARAHELGTTADWVVIYRDDSDGGGQWTVVTANTGEVHGKRVVRGRENETISYYTVR